jgi:hypothetical protein
MSVGHQELLAALAEREELEPGISLDGVTLMQRFSGLAGSHGKPWEPVARAAGQLRRLGWIDWQYMLYPGQPSEPRPEFIDENNLQYARDIVVTEAGHSVIANRRQGQTGATQINVVNSTVGQLALGDINNVTLSAVLESVERCIEAVEAASDAKEEARGVVRTMRDVAASAASSTAGAVIEAALRHSLGLP